MILIFKSKLVLPSCSLACPPMSTFLNLAGYIYVYIYIHICINVEDVVESTIPKIGKFMFGPVLGSALYRFKMVPLRTSRRSKGAYF